MHRPTRSAFTPFFAAPFFAAILAPLCLVGCLPHGEVFGPPTRLYAGLYASAGALVDVNGDGKADLVMGRDESHGLTSIRLGNGDGSFGPAMQTIGGNPATYTLAQDLNGDGKVDLVFANLVDGGYVSVCLGLGDGRFEAARHFVAGRSPLSLRLADVTGDGKLDLVLVNGRPDDNATVTLISGNLTVLAGNGDGTFQSPRSWVIGAEPRSVAVGDWNGDGRNDVAIGDEAAHRLTIYLNAGNADFKEQNVYEMPFGARSVSVADFNHDGKADLAVGHSGVTVLLGAGDGSFTQTATLPTDGDSIAIADYDGDGHPDIASQRRILFGDGAGHFKKVIEYDRYNRQGFVRNGDINGDGMPDLLVIDRYYSRVNLYFNRTVRAPKAISMVRADH